MPHDHDDDHAPIEEDDRPPTELEILEQAMRELLIDKGVFSAADVQQQIDDMDSRTPMIGAEIVARAWTDPDFKQKLLDDGTVVIASMGIDLDRSPKVVVVENTPDCHHVVVCTLCSCYPRMVLGIPPAWYKKKAYRSRVVVEPRAVLNEFGTDLSDDVEIRVLDSTADVRYLVIPTRPEGTDGMSEKQLAELVTRDSMIGVSQARSPALAA